MSDPMDVPGEVHIRVATPEGRSFDITTFSSFGLSRPLFRRPWKSEPYVAVYVLDDTAEAVFIAQLNDRESAERLASEIAREIESGTFEPEKYKHLWP